MRIDDDDPEDGPPERPYYLYGLVFIVGLGISVAVGWFLHLETLGANFP